MEKRTGAHLDGSKFSVVTIGNYRTEPSPPTAPARCLRVVNRFFGIQDFPYFGPGIRDSKAKSGRESGLEVCAGGGMPKTTLGITGLNEILRRDYGIEEPYWGHSCLRCVNDQFHFCAVSIHTIPDQSSIVRT